MTILTPGDTLVATYFNVVGSTKNFVITQGIAASGGPSVSSVLAAWRTAVTSSGSPFAAANMYVGWSIAKMYALQNTGGTMTAATNLTPVVGTATGSVTPSPNVSVLVTKHTAFAGVRYRGKMSVPPCNIDESSVSQAGVIGSLIVSARQSEWDFAYTLLTVAGMNPYLFHAPSKPGTVHPTTVPGRTPMTGWTVQPLVGTNRRRLR